MLPPSRPDLPAVRFPPEFQRWCTASGLDESFFESQVLAKIDFCLFCGDRAAPWELRCADCRRRCLDPDCHRSAQTPKEGECRERSSGVPEGLPLGPLRAPARDSHGFSYCTPTDVEFYCPCCLSGCVCRDRASARGRWGGEGLAGLTKLDVGRSDVRGGSRSCFVYRYRSPEGSGQTEFGMTYSPILRTDQRRESLDQSFLNRLPGLDWLSRPLSSRHPAYLLECVVKHLERLTRMAKAAKLYREILDKNGLFDFELSGVPSVTWVPRDTAVAGSKSCVEYCLPVEPRCATLGAVWSALFGASGPEGSGLAERGWSQRLRVQCGASADGVPVGVVVREVEHGVRIEERDMIVPSMVLDGLDLVFRLPARLLFRGFGARLVCTDGDGGPRLELASFESPSARHRIRKSRPLTESKNAVMSVSWSPVDLAAGLRGLVPEYCLSTPDGGCGAHWGREPRCEVPWGCWTALNFGTPPSDRGWGLRVRLVASRPSGCS